MKRRRFRSSEASSRAIGWDHNALLIAMSAFSVDNAAVGEIRRVFSTSKCQAPVAEIIDVGIDVGVSARFSDREDAIRAVASADIENSEQLSSFPRILIRAHERAEVPPACLQEVSGVAFVLGREDVEALRDFCLMFDGDRFLFRGPDNTTYTSFLSALEASCRSASSAIATPGEAIIAARGAWAQFYEKTHMPAFSEQNWASLEPYSATLENGVWTVRGTIPADYTGERYLTTVRASDGAVAVRKQSRR
jgi:hypothetical protein